MRVISFFLFLFLYPMGPALAAEPEAIDLPDAVSLALERHPDVEKARANAEILKGKIREVKAQAYPDISISVGSNRMRDPGLLNSSGFDKFPKELLDAFVIEGVNLFDYSLRVRQPIYTSGKVGTAMRLASIEAEGSVAEIDRARQDLALDVVKAYYALLWAERYYALVNETQEQKKQHAAMAKTRFQNGVATEVDVLRSEVAVANGAPDLVRAEAAIRQARALLNFYLVRPIDYPTRPIGEFEEKPWDEWDLEELALDAVRRRPELSRLRSAERSAAAQIELAEAESRLRVEAEGAYGIASRLPKNLFNANYTRWAVGMSVTLPVFDGFRRSGLVWQATAAQRATRLEREKVEQQVRLSLQQGLDEMKAARETVDAARANVAQAERVLEMMQANYQHGAATTLDVVDAQTAVSVARSNLLRGLHDLSVARASLRWTAGRTPWE